MGERENACYGSLLNERRDSPCMSYLPRRHSSDVMPRGSARLPCSPTRVRTGLIYYC